MGLGRGGAACTAVLLVAITNNNNTAAAAAAAAEEAGIRPREIEQPAARCYGACGIVGLQAGSLCMYRHESVHGRREGESSYSCAR